MNALSALMAVRSARGLRFAPWLLLSVAIAAAAEPRAKPAAPPPPPPPAEAQSPPSASGETAPLEPEITITSKGTEIHEEYRYNGRLYRVKVIPRHGAPYYLIYDEHGNFHRSDAEPSLLIPQWVIKRF